MMREGPKSTQFTPPTRLGEAVCICNATLRATIPEEQAVSSINEGPKRPNKKEMRLATTDLAIPMRSHI
jgi:hypothetical protein